MYICLYTTTAAAAAAAAAKTSSHENLFFSFLLRSKMLDSAYVLKTLKL